MKNKFITTALLVMCTIPLLGHSASFKKRADKYNKTLGTMLVMADYPVEASSVVVPLNDTVDNDLKALKWAECFVIEGSKLNDDYLARSIKRCE